MATIYVDSAASGSGTGADWTNAYTTLVAAAAGVTEASGDIFLLDDGHTETLSGALTVGVQSNGDQRGIIIRSVDKATDAYSPGAAFTVGSQEVNLAGCIVQGVNFTGATTVRFNGTPRTIFEGCTVTKGNGSPIALAISANTDQEWYNCTFALGSSYTSAFSVSSNARIRIINPTFTGTKGSGPELFTLGSGGSQQIIHIEGADLSGFDNAVDMSAGSTATLAHQVTIRKCAIPSSWEIDDGVGDELRRVPTWVKFIECESGTISGPIVGSRFYQHCGVWRPSATKYRDDGPTDPAAHSYEMTAFADRTTKRTLRAVFSEEIALRVAGGSARTLTFQVAHDAVGGGTAGALTNEEFWVDILGPGTGSTAEGYWASSRCALNGSPADVASSSKTWTGTAVGTKQQVALSFTPAQSGVAIVRAYFAPQAGSDKTIYVCPLVDVT